MSELIYVIPFGPCFSCSNQFVGVMDSYDFRARINLQCFGLGDAHPVVKTVQYLVDLDSVRDC